MNNFHAVGRIAAEIKLQKNEKGVVYTRFPLAISRGKNKDGENRGTDFPMITVFEKQAENLQKYSGKGKRMIIIMMTVAFLDMNMRTRGTFSKCFM